MLPERLSAMREQTRIGRYRRFRRAAAPTTVVQRRVAGLSPCRAMAEAFAIYTKLEKPVILPGERFFFTRTLSGHIPAPVPGLPIENISADWELLLHQGLSGRIAAAEAVLRTPGNTPESMEFLQSAIAMMQAASALSRRYADAAEQSGDTAGAALLRKVPLYPAETLHEALQSIFFMYSMLHLSAVTLQGLGRMDQYLFDYYRRDLAEKRLTRQEAGELLAEFFICLNRENDLYGMAQRGDDGQSVMLGGCRRNGSRGDNDLTLLLLETAGEIAMINPKINLRVDSETPAEILRAGVQLTGRGLGFPQYCNDEVVIPALIRFGYPPEDARDYAVAACWEFTVPDGRDIPNSMAINLALAADRAIRAAMREGLSWEELLQNLAPEIRKQLPPPHSRRELVPNPLFSALKGRCIERGRDLHSGGGRHYHTGAHGCGSSTAADALAAVKKWVYDEGRIPPARLLRALESNFADDEELRLLLRDHSPKTGNCDPATNDCLRRVFDAFADVLEEITDNGFGGRIRPGTGSAQNYALMTRREGPLRLRATADGRRDGEYISSSLSPAPGVCARGLLSILQTYGTLDYSRLCNGGPITLEVTPAYFRSPEAVEKTIALIHAFIRTGCQQLQMNTLDPAVLRDAQKHPERHRDLIVRVWGWSGYFVELDPMYQDQIIGRQSYGG